MAIEKEEVSKIIELDMTGIPEADQGDATQEVADYIKEQVLADLGRGLSPVTGHAFKKLSKSYEVLKEKESANPIANMELTGAMLDALVSEPQGDGTVWIGWDDPDQAIKSFAHNTGDGVPQRKSIPAPRENFRPEIRDGIDSILAGYRTDNAD